MKIIIFQKWKELALRGQNKYIGKIIANYYRLHYDNYKETVTLWVRPADRSTNPNELNKETRRIFTIDNQHNLTLNIENIYLDTSIKSVLSRLIHFSLQPVPSAKRQKYVKQSTHTFKEKNIKFIYVPNETVFNAYGNLIKAGTYTHKIIDTEFNKKLTQLSKTFREKLNITGNLFNLNATTTQIRVSRANNIKSFKNASRISSTQMYTDMQKKYITKDVFLRWQIFIYDYYNSSLYYNNPKPEPQIDVRKGAQKAINARRDNIADKQGKMTYIKVKQNVDETKP